MKKNCIRIRSYSSSASSSSFPPSRRLRISSWSKSKWFSIEVFDFPVMKTIWVTPLASSSSTTYWTTGFFATGSISFGCDLVAGSSRVPSPATGTTAIGIFMIRNTRLTLIL